LTQFFKKTSLNAKAFKTVFLANLYAFMCNPFILITHGERQNHFLKRRMMDENRIHMMKAGLVRGGFTKKARIKT
jgi:hypothetical protein